MSGFPWINALFDPSHSSEWISGLTGIVGALLGGFVTMMMTEWFNRRTRKQTEKDHRAQVAMATFTRLNSIYSVSRQICSHFNDAVAAAKAANVPLPLQVLPLQRMSTPIFFPLEEQWLLTKIGGPALINSIGSLDHSFNLLLDTVDHYTAERLKLFSMLPPPTTMKGHVGTSVFTPAQLTQIGPQMAICEMVLDQMLPLARDLVSDAFEAIRHLAGAKSMPLGRKWEVGLPDPSGKNVLLKAGCLNPLPYVN
jgi:hypothetical protein